MQYDALGNNLKCKNQHPRHPPPPPPHPPPPHHHAGLNHQHSTSANLGQSSFRANILAWVMSFLAARPLCKWQMSSSRLGLCSAFYGKYLPANPMKQNQYTYRYIMYYILSTYISIFKWKLICTKYHICICKYTPMEIYLIKETIKSWDCCQVAMFSCELDMTHHPLNRFMTK